MEGFSLDILGIQEYQKNRYPFILIDRVTEVIPGKSAKGYKNLTINEWYFPIHYDDGPIMPGMLMLEAMHQMFIMSILTMPGYKGMLVASLAVNNAKISRMLTPGDRLNIETELVSIKHGIAVGKCAGYTEGKFACSSNVTVGLPDIIAKYTPVKNN